MMELQVLRAEFLLMDDMLKHQACQATTSPATMTMGKAKISSSFRTWTRRRLRGHLQARREIGRRGTSGLAIQRNGRFSDSGTRDVQVRHLTRHSRGGTAIISQPEQDRLERSPRHLELS